MAKHTRGLYKACIKTYGEFYGEDESGLNKFLFGLGNAYYAGKLYEESKNCLLELLERCQDEGASDDFSRLSIAIYISKAHSALGEVEAARKLLEDSIESSKGLLQDDDLTLLAAQHNLAVVFRETGNFSKALEIFQPLLARSRQSKGDKHGSTLTTLGDYAQTSLMAGQIHRALDAFEEYLDSYREIVPPKTFASLLAQVSIELVKYQQYEVAEIYLKECLEIREKKMPEHWLIFNTQSVLGRSVSVPSDDVSLN